jgi:hypothetical protein
MPTPFGHSLLADAGFSELGRPFSPQRWQSPVVQNARADACSERGVVLLWQLLQGSVRHVSQRLVCSLVYGFTQFISCYQ